MPKLLKFPMYLLLALLTTLGLGLGLAGCPSADDDDATGDDDDATGDDDDATGDDDDATGDDDDATGDDDDSAGDDDDAGPSGSCQYYSGLDVIACDTAPQDDCRPENAPDGITIEWSTGACPANQSANCMLDAGMWFYYLDLNSPMLGPWCERCESGLIPADYCDSVGGIGDDDDSAGDDDDSAGDDDDSAGDDDDSAR